MKPLSEQLANLSVRAKNAEDAVAAAQKEAHDKIVARCTGAICYRGSNQKSRPKCQVC